MENILEKIADRIVKYFGWTQDDKKVILQYIKKKEPDSTLCDLLGVSRRYYRGIMEDIYKEEMIAGYKDRAEK